MVRPSFSSALEEALGTIERALESIRAGEGAESALHTLRACLLDSV